MCLYLMIDQAVGKLGGGAVFPLPCAAQILFSYYLGHAQCATHLNKGAALYVACRPIPGAGSRNHKRQRGGGIDPMVLDRRSGPVTDLRLIVWDEWHCSYAGTDGLAVVTWAC